MKILVTGSRNWTNSKTIAEAIWYHKPNVVVHGACPKGADKMASEICNRLNIKQEIYSADWKQYGKRAGFIRNAEMVNRGADLCIAFIKNNSKGATNTLQLAEKAGIPTEVYRED